VIVFQEGSDMKIDISAILSGETDIIAFDYPLTVTEEIDDITFSEPAVIKGEIRNMAGYMRLTLTASVPYETECARCLAPISSTLELDFERTVAVAGTLENPDDPENEDYIIASEGIIDPDEPLAEQILLELPTKTLCREDCAGLCPKCGHNLNLGSCGCETKEIDPRLAVLKQLLDDSTDNE